jgi:hypothetical protein
MVVISAVFVPIYYRLKVYTAYEYLEHRFDVRVRTLGALLFLIQRGLAAGITIYAPSIILSTILGWPLQLTNLAMGLVVVVYTVVGGTKAVSETQKQQMIIMLGGMMLAVVLVVLSLPEAVTVPKALKLAGALGKMNVVSFDLDVNSRYNFWSGITGGFFLAMAYFGTDQSQVQRYLSGRSVGESRLGLLFNGMIKIPMQFVILLTGIMVFVFYLFVRPPIFFNTPALEKVAAGPHAAAAVRVEGRYDGRVRSPAARGEGFRGHEDPAAKDELRAAAKETAADPRRGEGPRRRARFRGATRGTRLRLHRVRAAPYVPSASWAPLRRDPRRRDELDLERAGRARDDLTWTSTSGSPGRRRRGTTLVASKLFTARLGCVAIASGLRAPARDLIQAVNILARSSTAHARPLRRRVLPQDASPRRPS